jgi:hypothetical protein
LVVVVAFLVLLLLAMGVNVGVTLRYGLYEAAYVILPGALAYLVVTGGHELGLRELAVGWAVGYTLELAVFSVTAAVGARGVFAFYPLIAAAALAPALVMRRRRGATVLRVNAWAGSPATAWTLAVLLVIFFSYLANGYFAESPLPSMLHGPVSYDQDHVWELSIVSEALHHFPLQLPNLSGVTLHYHYLVYLHLAAIAQVAKIDPALTVFRLYPIEFIVLATLELFVLGRRLAGGSAWAGILSVVIAFLVGAFEPVPRVPSEFFTHLYEGPSASYGLGLVLFLAALIEIQDLLARERSGARRRLQWAIVAALLVGCAVAKVVILPILVGALVLLACYAWFTDRRALARVVMLTALAGGIYLVAYVVVYRGASEPIGLHPFHEINTMQPIAYLRAKTHGFLPVYALVTVAGVILETLKVVAPLAPGLGAALYYARGRLPAAQALLLGVLIVGVAADFLIFDVHSSQVYFLYLGYVPAAALSAAGLTELWHRTGLARWRAQLVEGTRVSPALVTAVVVLLLGTWLVEGPVGSRPGEPVPQAIWTYVDGNYASTANNNLTPQLYTGLRWVAAHTPTSAVLAVANRWQDPAYYDPRYCYYSAFAERRVMFECEYGTNHIDEYLPLSAELATPTAGPYPLRNLLTQQIFVHGNRSALAAARRQFGVSYLLFDRIHPAGGNLAAVERLGRVVYENPALVVVDVRQSRA